MMKQYYLFNQMRNYTESHICYRLLSIEIRARLASGGDTSNRQVDVFGGSCLCIYWHANVASGICNVGLISCWLPRQVPQARKSAGHRLPSYTL